MRRVLLLAFVLALAAGTAGAEDFIHYFSRGGTISAPLIAPAANNCAAVPYSFTDDSNTGVCSSAADTVGFVTGGTTRLSTSTTAVTSTVPILLPDGAASAPAIARSAQATQGMYFGPSSTSFTVGGAQRISFDSLGITVLGSTASSGLYLFNDVQGIYFGGSSDLILKRGAANTLSQVNGNNDQFSRLYATNGGYWERGVNSELLTIAAAASSTTTGDLLPADAIIEAVVVRVTVAIPTAATFTVGDTTQHSRFANGVSVNVDTTAVGLLHRNPADADAVGPVQTTADKIEITPDVQPANANGRVRIQVYFSRWVAPTT